MVQGFKMYAVDCPKWGEEAGDMNDNVMRSILSSEFGHSEEESKEIVANARLGVERTLANEEDNLKTIVFCAAPTDSSTDDPSKFEQAVVDIRDMDKGECIYALCLLDSITNRRIKEYRNTLESKDSASNAGEPSDRDTGSGASDLSKQSTVKYARRFGPELARR